MTAPDLDSQAAGFAEELTKTVRMLAPAAEPFRAQVIERRDGTRAFSVLQVPGTGIELYVNGSPLLRITVSYHCTLDRVESFLAVDKSKIAVYSAADNASEPLFRYEFVRAAATDIPGAHFQIHAHRDAFTYAMSRAGTATRRGKRRDRSTAVPAIREIHFPVGGHRFRPCLEDILEVLVHEFGVDCTADALTALADAREVWRRRQARSVVRDAPQDAAEVLRVLGYRVVEPAGDPPIENTRRLRDL